MKKLTIIVILLLEICITSCSPKSEEITLSERGILIDKNGIVISNEIYQPGFHIISKGDSLLKFPITERTITLQTKALTNNEDWLNVDLTFRYVPNLDSIIPIYNKFGLSFDEILAKPEAKSVIYNTFKQINSNKIKEDSSLLQSEFEKSTVDVFRSNSLEITYYDLIWQFDRP